MTVPPLPESPVIRIRCLWNLTSVGEGGTRFFVGYSGPAPNSDTLENLGAAVFSAWAANLSGLCPFGITLDQVVCEDITTYTGATGISGGSSAGSRTGTSLPFQCAAQANYSISRRYRGGRPKGFWPFGVTEDLADDGHFNTAFLTDMASNLDAFFSEVTAFTAGGFLLTGQVNLSLYNGFTVTTPPDGRTRTVSKYRDTAVVDPVTAVNPVARIGSQRRRRSATSP